MVQATKYEKKDGKTVRADKKASAEPKGKTSDPSKGAAAAAASRAGGEA